ncbi:metallophosphoesterase [uncultured Megasphaera sp.]|uniref:metallophosphoesterase n=1 Tax=uncultured Megasphaera sp. TaxID=165188 RepID=UPI002596AE2E|nr:metallophosphoesterase [uncultured Megasphaera sp.]
MSDTQYLGLVSDSHGRFGALEKMADAEPHVGAWIHAGDYSRDGDDLALYTDVPVFSVLGNNDLWGGLQCTGTARRHLAGCAHCRHSRAPMVWRTAYEKAVGIRPDG